MLPLSPPPTDLDVLHVKLKAIRREMREEYLAPHSHPWIVGFSGGKDSSLLLHLVIEAIRSVALVVAPLNLVCTLISSAATLLFPAWAKPGRDIQQPGFEAIGQRMLFVFAQLALVLAVEAWLGVRLLGKFFDNYDASAEQ